MDETSRDRRQPVTEADLAAVTIGGVRPHGEPVHLAKYDPEWPMLFARDAVRISRILGGVVKRIEHVGSTSVPKLAAKPVIDIVIEVDDSRDESAYVTPLESHGYTLRIREADWYEHRAKNSDGST